MKIHTVLVTVLALLAVSGVQQTCIVAAVAAEPSGDIAHRSHHHRHPLHHREAAVHSDKDASPVGVTIDESDSGAMTSEDEQDQGPLKQPTPKQTTPDVPMAHHHECIHNEVKLENVPISFVTYDDPLLLQGHPKHRDVVEQHFQQQKHVQQQKPQQVEQLMEVNGELTPDLLTTSTRDGQEQAQFTVHHRDTKIAALPFATSTYNNIRISYFFNVDGNGQCSTVGQQVTTYRGTYTNCTSNDILTTAKRNYILNTLLPAASTFLSKALNVIRVSGNLTLSGSRCGATPGIVVPSSHISPGIPNTDFVMYVASNPQSTVSSTVAFASTCFRDQNGRPIAGMINFIPSALSNAASPITSTTALDINTAIHETCHALGFSSPFFTTYGYLNASGVRVYTGGTATAYNSVLGKTVQTMTTPRVLREARAFFDCSSLTGVEIEDQGGSGTSGTHWEKRIFYNEFIAGVLSSAATYVSSLTLAYFEDTGFYTANYDAVDNSKMLWGYKKGCSFVQQKCDSTANQASGEFCFVANQEMCTYDLTAGGVCSINTYTSTIPSAYRYFTSAYTGGGVVVADYCPMALPYSNRVCIEPTNSDTQDIYGNTYHAASRCFASNLIQSDFDVSSSLETRCFPFSCSIVTGAILLNIKGQTVRCPSNLLAGYADTSGLQGFHGSIFCPNASALCGDPNAPTPAPTPAPPTPVPTPAPPGYTPAPAPVVHTAKLWYNFSMPTACADRAACAANVASLFPACRLMALRLSHCFGTNCDDSVQAWLAANGLSQRCSNMETFAQACQEGYPGAAAICGLTSAGAWSAAVSLVSVLIVAVVHVTLFL